MVLPPDLDIVRRSLPLLFQEGLVFTLALTGLSALGGLVLGALLAPIRRARLPILSGAAALYIKAARALPVVLVILCCDVLMRQTGPWPLPPWPPLQWPPLQWAPLQWAPLQWAPLQVDGFVACVIAFSLVEAAYFAEILRTALRSVPRVQAKAGLALGLTPRQVRASVVRPQALRALLPRLLAQVIVLFQDTSLVYVLSLPDLLGAASGVAQREGARLPLLLVVAATYAAISLVGGGLVRLLQGPAGLSWTRLADDADGRQASPPVLR